MLSLLQAADCWPQVPMFIDKLNITPLTASLEYVKAYALVSILSCLINNSEFLCLCSINLEDSMNAFENLSLLVKQCTEIRIQLFRFLFVFCGHIFRADVVWFTLVLTERQL